MNNKQYRKILETLLNILEEGVHIVDSDGISILYNNAMAEMEQVDAANVIGLNILDCFPEIAEEDSTIWQVLQSRQPIYNKVQNYTGPTGKQINTINATVPVEDEQGNLMAAIEVAHDITRLTNLNDKLMQLQEMVTPAGKIKPKAKGIKKYRFEDLVGKDPEFIKCVNRARKAAGYDVPVLIYGETGTGKELFSQSIHYSGIRKDKPFLAQNCAALPENLLEGILFGTAKGGFTGAVDRSGLFEQANGGTLFLDELNSMPIDLQGKLLRVLQESYVRHIGGSKDIPVDVRIIASVNEDPQELIERGTLRSDLYYRLNVVNINIPPLRDRRSDIPYLAESLIRKHSSKMDKKPLTISRPAIRALMEYDYPGNVRELENIIIQALFMVDDENILSPDLLNLPCPRKVNRKPSSDYQAGEPLTEYMERVEKEILLNALDLCHGNVTHCASVLHLKRQTLQYKLIKYGILT
ncbi:MAG: sigma 54-interacting transcriptional regulator [Eubacterium sp.]|nr:sigma 54-interacting transcriptional regulator [Eubacterium sp.]